MAATAQADWQPPEKPDPTRILNEAWDDTKAGRYAVALAKHAWFHEHALDIQPSQGGVRLSFALMYWIKLAEQYPPALLKMQEIRDSTRERVLNDKQLTGEKFFHAFMDLKGLNRELKDKDETVEIFKNLDQSEPDKARQTFHLAQPALIRAKEFALCGKYLDPDRDWNLIRSLYQANLKFAQQPNAEEHFLVSSEQRLIDSTATLVALLVLNDRQADADNIARKAREYWNDPRLDAALTKAQQGELPASKP